MPYFLRVTVSSLPPDAGKPSGAIMDPCPLLHVSLRVSQHLDASSISLRASLFSLSCLLPLEFPQQHITFLRDESGIYETRRSFSSIVTASIDALGSFER